MKGLITSFILICLLSQNMKAQMDTLSYSIGVVVAQKLAEQGISDVNEESLSKGIIDVLQGNELKIDAEQADALFSAYVHDLQKQKSEMAKQEGIDFLAKNKERSEVTTLDSGLQYEVMTQGDGAKPSINDAVKVHYHGTLIDGKVFDSSVQRGEPISFPLKNVITGWQLGLQEMSVGSKYKLFIPYDLAYGDRGAGAVIPPYSALVFEVELLGIE